MVDIPVEIQIKALLCSGRTYLFKAQEHTGDKKHFHVVLNTSPHEDRMVVMVTATTISLVHASDYWAELVASGIVVQATQGDADFIKHPTLFRCDAPIVMPLDVVISKLAGGVLLQKGLVPPVLLNQLRQGLLRSKTVAEEIKELIR